MSDIAGREKVESIDVPMHVIAYRLIIDGTRSRVLAGAGSGRFFFFLNNKPREDLSKA